MDKFEELIKIAAKALQDGYGFNEIELTDGSIKVRLVRFTPIPYYVPPVPETGMYRYSPPGIS